MQISNCFRYRLKLVCHEREREREKEKKEERESVCEQNKHTHTKMRRKHSSSCFQQQNNQLFCKGRRVTNDFQAFFCFNNLLLYLIPWANRSSRLPVGLDWSGHRFGFPQFPVYVILPKKFSLFKLSSSFAVRFGGWKETGFDSGCVANFGN